MSNSYRVADLMDYITHSEFCNHIIRHRHSFDTANVYENLSKNSNATCGLNRRIILNWIRI